MVSTVCACAAPLEITAILVRVAKPYITETLESFTSTRQRTKLCCTPLIRSESLKD